MRSVYQQRKNRDYGVQSCEGCLEKQREIDRLKEEIQQLRVKLSAKKRKDKEGFFGSSTPSSQLPVKANTSAENQNKQGGARLGHQGNGRKSHPEDSVDEVRIRQVEPFCLDCKTALRAKGYRERSVLDIDPITIKRVVYRLERKQRPVCGVAREAKAEGVLPKSLLSNQLLAEIVDSHYVQGMPLARVCGRWQLNYGTVVQALHRMARMFAEVLDELKANYRQEVVRHADETPCRTDGQQGYCWLFTSARVSLHLYRQTRGAKVVEEVFGREKLEGYLVVDRYAGYNRVGCLIQYCYAHLLREMKELQTQFADEQEVEAFAQRMIELLAQAMRLQTSKPEDVEYYRAAQLIKQEIIKACLDGSHHLAVKRWQDFFVEEAEKLYHWVRDRRVPCENNRAERELRPTVIARKVSHGSQAEEGAHTREVLMSVMQTLKKRVANPRQKFKEVLDKGALNPKLNLSESLFQTDST
jgi:transposase